MSVTFPWLGSVVGRQELDSCGVCILGVCMKFTSWQFFLSQDVGCLLLR